MRVRADAGRAPECSPGGVGTSSPGPYLSQSSQRYRDTRTLSLQQAREKEKETERERERCPGEEERGGSRSELAELAPRRFFCLHTALPFGCVQAGELARKKGEGHTTSFRNTSAESSYLIEEEHRAKESADTKQVRRRKRATRPAGVAHDRS